MLLRLAALFGAGEESVTRELLPLIRVIAREGRLEEEMFLAAFLWEEAKHVEAFRIFFDEVAADDSDLSRFHTPSYRRIFYDELPAAMAPAGHRRVADRRGPRLGDLQHDRRGRPGRDRLPRLPRDSRAARHPARHAAGRGHLQRDESRHLAYGVHLLSRLVAEHGEPVWRAIEGRMGELLRARRGGHPGGLRRRTSEPPFGLESAVFVDFARAQFGKRLERIERLLG